MIVAVVTIFTPTTKSINNNTCHATLTWILIAAAVKLLAVNVAGNAPETVAECIYPFLTRGPLRPVDVKLVNIGVNCVENTPMDG